MSVAALTSAYPSGPSHAPTAYHKRKTPTYLHPIEDEEPVAPALGIKFLLPDMQPGRRCSRLFVRSPAPGWDHLRQMYHSPKGGVNLTQNLTATATTAVDRHHPGSQEGSWQLGYLSGHWSDSCSAWGLPPRSWLRPGAPLKPMHSDDPVWSTLEGGHIHTTSELQEVMDTHR
jgi:hypothetical protein